MQLFLITGHMPCNNRWQIITSDVISFNHLFFFIFYAVWFLRHCSCWLRYSVRTEVSFTFYSFSFLHQLIGLDVKSLSLSLSDSFIFACCAADPHWQIKAVAEDALRDESEKVEDAQPPPWHNSGYRRGRRARSALRDAYQKLMESRNHRGAAGSLRLARGTGEGHHCWAEQPQALIKPCSVSLFSKCFIMDG